MLKYQGTMEDLQYASRRDLGPAGMKAGMMLRDLDYRGELHPLTRQLGYSSLERAWFAWGDKWSGSGVLDNMQDNVGDKNHGRGNMQDEPQRPNVPPERDGQHYQHKSNQYTFQHNPRFKSRLRPNFLSMGLGIVLGISGALAAQLYVKGNVNGDYMKIPGEFVAENLPAKQQPMLAGPIVEPLPVAEQAVIEQ